MPALPNWAKTNFDTLLRAAARGDLALIDCTDKDGNQVPAVCAVLRVKDEYLITPIARLLEGNPYNELFPPAP